MFAIFFAIVLCAGLFLIAPKAFIAMFCVIGILSMTLDKEKKDRRDLLSSR